MPVAPSYVAVGDRSRDGAVVSLASRYAVACVIYLVRHWAPVSTGADTWCGRDLGEGRSGRRRPDGRRDRTGCGTGCVIASNISTLPISSLVAVLSPLGRARFVGTHYFSPVSRMPLVGVVAGFDTDPLVVTRVIDWLRGIGKTPIAIKDVPGFAVDRLLHAMLIEVVKLVKEGVATPADLNTACRLGLGHPIVPFALMDVVHGRSVPAGPVDPSRRLWRALPPASSPQTTSRRGIWRWQGAAGVDRGRRLTVPQPAKDRRR